MAAALLPPRARLLRVAHRVPGRIRLQLPWLRREGAAAAEIADDLALLRGLERVTVRAYTGSVICEYDPALFDAEAIVERVQRRTGATPVRTRDELEASEREAYVRLAEAEGSTVARAVASRFKAWNIEILKASEGRLDLGTLAALSFSVAGAVQIAFRRDRSAPPWFNLAWWAFRTFTELERRAIAVADEKDAGVHEL